MSTTHSDEYLRIVTDPTRSPEGYAEVLQNIRGIKSEIEKGQPRETVLFILAYLQRGLRHEIQVIDSLLQKTDLSPGRRAIIEGHRGNLVMLDHECSLDSPRGA